MNMERPPRNYTPSQRRSYRGGRRHKNKPLELHFASQTTSATSPVAVAPGSCAPSEGDSTLDDLSKYAYSDSGEKEPFKNLNLLEDSGTQMGLQASSQNMCEASITSAVMEGSAGKETNTVKSVTPSDSANTQSEDLNLISLNSFSQDDIMSAMDAEDSLDLNIKRQGMEEGDLMDDLQNQHLIHQLIISTNAANSHKNNSTNSAAAAAAVAAAPIHSQQEPQPHPHTQQHSQTPSVAAATQAATHTSDETSHSNKQLSTIQSASVIGSHQSADSKEIVFDPNDTVASSTQEGFEVRLSDLEKSMLAGQAKARAAEIDSPLHIQRGDKKRSDAEIPPALKEVYVPNHKRTPQQSNNRRGKDEKSHSYRASSSSSRIEERQGRPPRHSSLSPFVLKRSQSERGGFQKPASAVAQQDGGESNASSRLKTIYSRGDSDIDESERSRDISSSVATAKAQRSTRRQKNILLRSANSSRKNRTMSSRSSRRSRGGRKKPPPPAAATAPPATIDRGTEHVVPQPPSSSHNSCDGSERKRRSRSMSRTRSRSRSVSRRVLKRVKSAGCIMCTHNSFGKSAAEEDTQRGDTERNMTDREQTSRGGGGDFNDQVYDDIHYIMNDPEDISEEGEYEASESEEEDNKTKKSRMSRMSGSIKRSFTRTISKRLSSRRNLTQMQMQRRQDEKVEEENEEERSEDDNNGDDNSSRGRSSETSSLTRTSRSKSRRNLLSISRSIRASFRRATPSRRSSKRTKREKHITGKAREGTDMGDSSRMSGYMADQSSRRDHHQHHRQDGHRNSPLPPEQSQDHHQHDIVFDPNQSYDSPAPATPQPQRKSSPVIIDVDELQEIDVDELQELREKEKEAQLQQKQQQVQQEQQSRPRPSLVTPSSPSGRSASMEFFTSQDFTVVHTNKQRQQQHRRGSNSSGSSGSLDRGPGTSISRQQSLSSLRGSSHSHNGIRPKRPAAESMGLPKGPPNTRYNHRRYQSGSSRVLGSAPEATASTQAESVANRRQMLLETRGRSVRTMVRPDNKTDPRHVLFHRPEKRRARSLEVWERRGSF